MDLIQIISLLGSLVFMGMIIYAAYREKLQEAYAIIWMLTGVLTIAASVSGTFMEFLARMLGIKTPAFAILLILLCGILLLLLQLTIVISQQQKKIGALAEELAILQRKNSDRERAGEK